MGYDQDRENETDRSPVFGIAALSLLEALILTLQAKGVLTTDEIDEAFEAAIDAHHNRHEAHSNVDNAQAAAILSKLRIEGNSVRLEL